MYKAVGGVVSILAVMKAGPLLRVESSIFCPEYIEKTNIGHHLIYNVGEQSLISRSTAE